MEDALGYLIAIGIVLFVIYLLVVYVLPIVLGICAAIGAIVGIGVAIKNFFGSIISVLDDRKCLQRFKSKEIQKKINTEAADGNYSDYVFEECTRKSYFLGPCFQDILLIIKGAFLLNFEDMPDFSRGEEWYSRIFFFIWSLCQLITQVVLGTVATALFALVMLSIAFVLTDIIYVLFGIVLLIETIYLKLHSISFRCQKCTHEYKLPVYECLVCNIKHTNLKPGRYGVFKRKCLCGAKLPLTVRGVGKKSGVEFTITNLKSYCPHCGNEDNAGITHPVSIALIGGASAGKTTFKVAFLKTLLDEEVVKYNIETDFPSSDYEREFKQIESYFRGMPIPSTNRGIEYDIITFSFFLKHKNFDVDRIVHLYDMPGEVFQRRDAKEGWEMHSFNDGAVFLIDPYSLPKIFEESKDERKGSSMGISKFPIEDMIETLIDTLRQVKMPKTKQGKFKIPIALSINKADSLFLKQRIGDEAVKKLMQNHPDVFTDSFVVMDYLCRCFLSENGCINFIENLDANFEVVHFFSCSPIGSVPKGVKTPFYPINIIPIMQWLMIRTDKHLAGVWKPEIPVIDLVENQKNLYKINSEYYNEIIVLLEEKKESN